MNHPNDESLYVNDVNPVKVRAMLALGQCQRWARPNKANEVGKRWDMGSHASMVSFFMKGIASEIPKGRLYMVSHEVRKSQAGYDGLTGEWADLRDKAWNEAHYNMTDLPF